MNKMKCNPRLQYQLEVLKPMTWPQRIDHIWSNFKEVILVTVVTLIVVFGVLFNVLKPRKDVMMGGMLINTYFDAEAEAYLGEQLLAHLGGDPEKQKVDLFVKTFSDPDTLAQDGDVLTSIYAMMYAEQVDYLFMDQVGLESMIKMQGMMDLREFFTAEELEQLNDRVFYGQQSDEEGNLFGDPIPVAIKMSDVPLIQEHEQYNYRDIYLGFAVNAPNRDSLRTLWDYILAWDTSESS